jgi:DNA-binding MarR family transcriptional regulator
MIGLTQSIAIGGGSLNVMTRTTATEYHCLALLDHLARVGRRAAETSLAPSGLRPRHLVALRLLSEHGPASQQGLSEVLSLDPSNVVGLLNELEERGFITRRRDPADRRRHIVELSTDGEDELLMAQHRLSRAEDDLLRALSADERATLHGLLVRAAGGQLPTNACAKVDEPPPYSA